jgi:hypothetical protein
VTAVTLHCVELDVDLEGELLPGPVAKWPRKQAEGPVRVRLLHAKRDGQVLFFFADDLTGAPLRNLQTSGRPGDIFAFSGDAGAAGNERRGQVLIVYGEDNLFVEPFDRGFIERGYQRIGAFGGVDELRRLGEHIWRHGAQRAELEVTQ